MTLSLRHGKLPAYGRQLLAMREAGEIPADPVIVTDSWPLALWFRNKVDWCVLVCDPPEARFDLSPVHGLDVIAVHIDDLPPRWIEQLRAHEPRSLEIHEARAFARELEPILSLFLDSRRPL
jgi:hypothetical protein